MVASKKKKGSASSFHSRATHSGKLAPHSLITFQFQGRECVEDHVPEGAGHSEAVVVHLSFEVMGGVSFLQTMRTKNYKEILRI